LAIVDTTPSQPSAPLVEEINDAFPLALVERENSCQAAIAYKLNDLLLLLFYPVFITLFSLIY